MTEKHIDVEAVLASLKDFQRRTARWAFERMFADRNPAFRFLVADEVGLGKTHVAKGVIAQVIDHLRRTGDMRGTTSSMSARTQRSPDRTFASSPLRALSQSRTSSRLTLLALAELNEGPDARSGRVSICWRSHPEHP